MYKIKSIFSFDSKNIYNFIDNKISDINYKIILSENNKKNNLSFVILEKNTIKAICPFYFEKNIFQEKQWNEGSLFQLSLPGIITEEKISIKELRQIILLAFQEIDNLCLKHSISKIKINFSDLINFDLNSKKYQLLQKLLLEFHYINASFVGNRIDLKKDIEKIYGSFSKGHKSVIKNNKYLFDFGDFNKNNLNYKNFYNLIARANYLGLVTFLNESGQLYEMYKQNLLEFLDIYINDKKLGYILFAKINKTVQYYVSLNLKKEYVIHHAAIWEAVKKYKKQKYDFFNLGVIAYGPLFHFIPSKKSLNVSVFKRGFKGDSYPLVIFEKYFNKDRFKKEQNIRTNNFLKYLS